MVQYVSEKTDANGHTLDLVISNAMDHFVNNNPTPGKAQVPVSQNTRKFSGPKSFAYTITYIFPRISRTRETRIKMH